VSNIKISVESWEPEYASAISELELEPSKSTTNLEVERRTADWTPISPDGTIERVGPIYFVDGVRRIEAMVWLEENGQRPSRGICASYAAGIVRANERAQIIDVKVTRGLFSSLTPPVLHTKAGEFQPVMVASDELKDLVFAMQERLGGLEIDVASELQLENDAIVIVDGPLSGHKKVPGALGFVKTHRVSYLPEPQSRILKDLAPGQRTPIFLSTTSWTRYSWYLRLAGPVIHPFSGLVRLEATGELGFVQQLANRSSSMLPMYASLPHKDPRAPQNLFPIGGLERELRRRLGDSNLIHRALKVATVKVS
jgi:hypothetical protein